MNQIGFKDTRTGLKRHDNKDTNDRIGKEFVRNLLFMDERSVLKENNSRGAKKRRSAFDLSVLNLGLCRR